MRLPAIKTALSYLDPANTNAPVIGRVRKFNKDHFGTPAYADPNLSKEDRAASAINMYAESLAGPHGVGKADVAASKFGRELRMAGQVAKNEKFAQDLRTERAINTNLLPTQTGVEWQQVGRKMIRVPEGVKKYLR